MDINFAAEAMEMKFYPLEEHFRFWVAGVSHHKSLLDVRGKFALDKEAIRLISQRVRETGVSSIMILSTCNRTEIYTYATDINPVLEIFREVTGVTPAVFDNNVFVLQEEKAYRHIFEVAAGLDSQVLGDYQIVSQIKDAYQVAQAFRCDDAYLSRLIQMVFQTGKRIKNETQLSAGKSSVSSVTVDYILENIVPATAKKIILYGAGKIGKVICQQLVAFVPASHITVINRTPAKARELAREFGFLTAPEEDLAAQIAQADILVVATAARQPVIHTGNMLPRNGRPLLAFDLSVPRNIETSIDDMENIRVVNLDQLHEIQNETFRTRRASILPAREIIAEKMQELTMWLSHRKLLPYVQQIKDQVELQRQAVMHALQSVLDKEAFGKAEEVSKKKADKAISNYIAHLRSTPHNAENLPELDITSIQFLNEQ